MQSRMLAPCAGAFLVWLTFAPGIGAQKSRAEPLSPVPATRSRMLGMTHAPAATPQGATRSTSVTALTRRPTSASAPARPKRSLRAPDAAAGVVPPDQREEDARAAERRRQQWLVAIEGVTHAPIDWGVQLGVEMPFRLRVSGAYGWVPGVYMDLLTGIAAGASGNSYAKALLERAQYSGRTWRVQLGARPFRSLGLYADVGYARLIANGSLDLASTEVPALARLGGGYRANTELDMWLLELGYQGQFAERIVLAVALGAMGTFEAATSIKSIDGAPSSGALDDAATQADAALESYGIVPTLTLRAGFDLI